MATVNILQGSITGSVGKITGSVWKGKPTIRAKVFSKAPPQELQTASVRAFEKLNRISSAIAQTGFARLGLSAKNIHKHNSVARWLSPIIRNHAFEPQNIIDVIPQADNFRITSFVYNPANGKTNIEVRLVNGFVPLPSSYLFVIVFDDNGNTYFAHCDILKNLSAEFFIDNFGKQVYSVLAFHTEPLRNKVISKNLIYKRGSIMRYSLEEQPTGDLWLDGKPIYQKSYSVNLTNVTVGNSFNQISIGEGFDTFINFSFSEINTGVLLGENLPIFPVWSSFQGNTPFQHNPLLTITPFAEKGDDQILVRISTTSVINELSFIITFHYTKRSDQPVVDG